MPHGVQKVREEIPVTLKTIDPVLRDHLPLLMEDIITIMKDIDLPVEEKNNFEGMLDNSSGHGRHRSSSAGYDVAQVIKEYMILHNILAKELREHKAYTIEVADLLTQIMEYSMLYAIVAFNDALDEVRQKILGIVAHDIRNPLSTCYLSMDLLNQDANAARFDKIKNMSRSSLKRALELTENLLESVIVKAGEGINFHFSEKDLRPYILSVYDEAKEIYSNKIILQWKEEQIKGIFDTTMIRRVLENVINNAVKYGFRKSPVTIKVENEADEVRISIHNEGNAIPKDRQEEIFKFMATSNGRDPRHLKSWGMGLSLMKAVTEVHGGHPELQSSEENGTTFTMVLKKNANKPQEVKTKLVTGVAQA